VCVQEIHGWCATRRLQLNPAVPAKTELIWFGSRTSHRTTERMDLSLHGGNETIKPVSVVRDLGVHLDEELTIKQHISKVASIAFYHIRRLKKVRSILGAEITASLVSAFTLNRLDYCNTVLASGQSTGLHYCTATACSERGSTTHQRSSSTRSRDISTTRATLAACSASYHINCAC